MSRRRLLWLRKLGHPEQVDKNGKVTGRASQCGGNMDKLESTKPSNMKRPIPNLKRK